MSNVWFKSEEKRKVTYRMRENKTEIYFVLMKKNTGGFAKCEGNPWQLQHVLVVTDIDKKKVSKVVI